MSWNRQWQLPKLRQTSHTLTGVWVEISCIWAQISEKCRHTLTGVWVEIETIMCADLRNSVTPSRVCELKFHKSSHMDYNLNVTPSRVCELKFVTSTNIANRSWSHPHGCVSWNFVLILQHIQFASHPHGCVSWNFNGKNRTAHSHEVTPSRVCELKSPSDCRRQWPTTSHPHGCVSWNRHILCRGFWLIVTPSRVCELKWYFVRNFHHWYMSHPHGCVSWNKFTLAVGCGV